MTLKAFIQLILICSLFGGLALCLIAVWIRSLCGNDQPKKVRTIIEHENREQIVGDGAWCERKTISKRMQALREIEPRAL